MLDTLETELKIRGFSGKTVQAYLFHNRKFLEFSKKQPQDIQTADIKRYMAHLLGEKKLKPASVNLSMSALRFFYDEMMGKGVFTTIRLPKAEKKLPTVLTKDEMRALIGAVENPKHRLLIKMMYSSGLRVSECMNLQIDDLDLKERFGLVRSGKGRKDRNIILSQGLVKDLQEYLGGRELSGHLFQVNGRPLGVRQAQHVVVAAQYHQIAAFIEIAPVAADKPAIKQAMASLMRRIGVPHHHAGPTHADAAFVLYRLSVVINDFHAYSRQRRAGHALAPVAWKFGQRCYLRGSFAHAVAGTDRPACLMCPLRQICR